MKKCSKCGKSKPETAFTLDKSKKDGFCQRCKECVHDIYLKKYNLKRPRGTNKEITYNVDENGCWNCTSHYIKPDGYPLIVYKRKRIPMSRYMYLTNIGEIPDGMVMRHKCDNKKCINTDHLEYGTYSDNMQDMLLRNRRKHTVGIKNPQAKVTDKIVIEILKQHKKGEKQTDIARKLNLSRNIVNRIVLKKTWKHINIGG